MQQVDFQTQILIVGGGPSGATTARILSQHNISNILIEKNNDFDKPCGGGVKEEIFDEFKIPKDLIIKSIKQFNLKSKKQTVSIDLSHSPFAIVRRNQFDKTLRQLAQKDGTKLLEATFIKCEIKNTYVFSTIKLNDTFYTIKSKYLVGADGVSSKIRSKYFHTQTNKVLTNYCITPDTINLHHCDFYFGDDYAPGEYTWLFPHANDLSFGTVTNNNIVHKLFEKLKKENNYKGKTKGYFIPKWSQENLFYNNRIFLVGDAANQVLPFTYEGIYYVIHSAKILAHAIIKDNPYLYEKEWKNKYYKKFNFFRRLQKIFLSNDFMVNIMLDFFKNKTLQSKALDYWSGKNKPIPLYKIPYKIIKNILLKN